MEKKDRDFSIDVLRFIAAFLITNSHLACLYPDSLKSLATGGAIGDALFFFCSGYTLFLGKQRGFMNYYKRRINRIYPSVGAMAIIACIFFRDKSTIIDIILLGGGWFVACIMVYYVVLWFVQKFLKKKMEVFFYCFVLFAIGCFWIVPRQQGTIIYGTNDYRLVFFFMYMVFGAILGHKQENKPTELPCYSIVIKLILSLLSFYGILFVYMRNGLDDSVQLFSFIPLFGIIYYLYRICKNTKIVNIYKRTLFGKFMYVMSGLCLEIYMSQSFIIEPFSVLEIFYPLNFFLFFFIVITLAYAVRSLARFLSQTFSTCDYNWEQVFRI